MASSASQTASKTSVNRVPEPKRKKQGLIKADGSKTSVSLEPEFWSALKEIARVQRRSATAVVREISNQPHANLTSAVRLYVLRHF
jgi:predicted DNA-binding ribbon-helix-helix protein